jgi:hypothetical protein
MTNLNEITYGNAPAKYLTKREYFAAMAMQGLCTSPELTIEITAVLAVKQAELLIKSLNKTT